MDEAGVERWLAYRANRNTAAHDHGQGFANITLVVQNPMPQPQSDTAR